MAQSTKMECPICTNNVDTNRFVECPSCNYEVCFSCIDKYIKNSKGDVNCMSCKNVWDRTFMFRSIPPSIMFSTIKEKRETVLFDIEKAMLPHTMPLIPLALENEKLNEKKKDLLDEMNRINSELMEINNQLARNTTKRYHIIRNMNNDPIANVVAAGPSNSKSQSKPQKEIIETVCLCPKNECRGFIIKKDMKCGICSTEICKDCHAISTDNHTCNKNDIESVNLIKKECKACPSCNVPSRKTEGCSQVWCMMCKTAWDWNTRKIETGAIHATDYYNYMRNNKIPIAPVCGQYINPATHFTRFENNYPKLFTATEREFIWNQFRLIGEYRYRMNDTIPVPDNLDLRIKFLKKEIDEKQWKSLLHKRDKEVIFKTEIHRMKVAYVQTMSDAITYLCNSQTEKELIDSLKYCKDFHEMMNGEYEKLAKCFNSKRKTPFVK